MLGNYPLHQWLITFIYTQSNLSCQTHEIPSTEILASILTIKSIHIQFDFLKFVAEKEGQTPNTQPPDGCKICLDILRSIVS